MPIQYPAVLKETSSGGRKAWGANDAILYALGLGMASDPIEIGLVYSLVALGVFLSFRILDFPDLTVDGSFPLGAAVAATLIVNASDPWLASPPGLAAGAGRREGRRVGEGGS